MISDLVKAMGDVELGPDELDQPISVTRSGKLATVRDLIADKAPRAVRSMFRDAKGGTTDHVLSVSDLKPNDLRTLAVEVLQKTDPKRRVYSINRTNGLDRDELIAEVKDGTAEGAKIIDAIRLGSLLIEAAIVDGKIRRRDKSGPLVVPKLDF